MCPPETLAGVVGGAVMGCCACAGACSHVGPCRYCVAHGGDWTVVAWTG